MRNNNISIKSKANWLSLTVVNGVLVIVTPTGKVIFNVRKHDVKVNISNGACNQPSACFGTVHDEKK